MVGRAGGRAGCLAALVCALWMWAAAGTARAAVEVSGGAYAGTGEAGFHVAVWVRPEGSPYTTWRFGGRLQQDGNASSGAVEASVLYDPPAFQPPRGLGALRMTTRPYGGAGAEVLWQSAGGSTASGGSLYALVGVRQSLDASRWLWIEVRYSVAQWGGQAQARARVVGGFGLRWQ
ncbi:MAG TPA: hypothetical protein VIL11_00120 [Limnochordales bacterium]